MPLTVGTGLTNVINALQGALDCQGTNRPGGEFNHVGCLVDYANKCAGGQRLPEEGESMSPWVAVTFEGTGSTITVGNDSSPNTKPLNVACIKSFEFGYSDGMTVRVIIQDEQGGSFVTFMEHILKHFACLKDGNPATVRMKFRFGWTKSTCNTPLPMASSRCYYALCDSVETNINNGIFTFEITGKDLCVKMLEGGSDKVKGGAGAQQAMPVREAVTQFLTKAEPPNVTRVRFCKMEGGQCREIGFKDGGIQGPKAGPFCANGNNKIVIVMNVLKNFLSENGKSWIPQYNAEVPGGEIIFWEDPKPHCNELADWNWDKNCIGTYIVNGGKSSPVIDFSPKIRWDFSRLTSVGGDMGDGNVAALDGKGSKNPGNDCQGLNRQANPGAGQRFITTAKEFLRNLFAADGQKKGFEGAMQQFKALKILHDNIEADLTIVGDPTIVPPSEGMWYKNATIVVINPYFLTVSGDAACGEWLAVPICNEVLSNKAWMVKSITHRIEGGKFTTTIGVYLTAPGIDTPPGTGLGGWTNGWKPIFNCT